MLPEDTLLAGDYHLAVCVWDAGEIVELQEPALAFALQHRPPVPYARADYLPIMSEMIRRDARTATFFAALDYINYERVPGDVVEFGVYTGISLALFAQGQAFDPKGMTRRFVGFDSFDGLPPSADAHARRKPRDCAVNHSWHPILPSR